MGEPMDDRYATFREHAELRERTATLEASVAQIAPTLARIETLVAARQASPPVDHGALAMQRALDALSTAKPSGASPFLIGFAIVGALAIGVLGAMLFTGN